MCAHARVHACGHAPMCVLPHHIIMVGVAELTEWLLSELYILLCSDFCLCVYVCFVCLFVHACFIIGFWVIE
jgi:hypothetical protein